MSSRARRYERDMRFRRTVHDAVEAERQAEAELRGRILEDAHQRRKVAAADLLDIARQEVELAFTEVDEFATVRPSIRRELRQLLEHVGHVQKMVKEA